MDYVHSHARSVGFKYWKLRLWLILATITLTMDLLPLQAKAGNLNGKDGITSEDPVEYHNGKHETNVRSQRDIDWDLDEDEDHLGFEHGDEISEGAKTLTTMSSSLNTHFVKKRSPLVSDDEDLYSSGDGDIFVYNGMFGHPDEHVIASSSVRPTTDSSTSASTTAPSFTTARTSTITVTTAISFKKKYFRVALTIQKTWSPALEMSSSLTFKAYEKDLEEAFQQTDLNVESLQVIQFININDTTFVRCILDLGLVGVSKDQVEREIQSYVEVGQMGNLRLRREAFDVRDIGGERCNDDQFRCSNGQCIPDRYRCDKYVDCGDATDEENCLLKSPEPCSGDAFTCAASGGCVSRSAVCNSRFDCADGSDEINCPVNCPIGHILCDLNNCLPDLFRCDGLQHCHDGSDEDGCPPRCSPEQYTCLHGGTCLNSTRRCDRMQDCPRGDDEVGCGFDLDELELPPEHWNESWADHKEPLTRVFTDSHLVAYFDVDINPSIDWPFSPLSKTWNYVKDIYGLFQEDPHLFLILHAKKYRDCVSTVRSRQSPQNRNLIDCGVLENEKKSNKWDETSQNFEAILIKLGEVITYGAQGMINDADQNVSKGRMTDIVIYDLFLHQKNHQWNFTAQWKRNKAKDSFDNVFWFRDWYLQIYERYGGASVLHKYYSYTKAYWDKDPKGNYKYLNRGEFVHFWSQAAGVDLEPLAQLANITSNSNFSIQLKAARAKFSTFNYSESVPTKALPASNPPGNWDFDDGRPKVTLAYFDDDVAIYSENFLHRSNTIESFKLISAAYKYLKRTYAPQNSPKRLLYISLHNGKNGTSCKSLESAYESNRDNHNVIYCFLEKEVIMSPEKIIYEISVRTFMKKSVGESGYGFWEGFDASRLSMASVLVYDAFLHLGKLKGAEQWKQERLNESPTISPNYLFWFRDRYLKIYETERHNDSTSASLVLAKFITLLREKWLGVAGAGTESGAKEINVGELVHFWSWSASINRKYVVFIASSWSSTNDEELLAARIQYPNYAYKPENSNETFPEYFHIVNKIPSPIRLELRSLQETVGIYSESEFQLATKTFLVVSKVWSYLKTWYSATLKKSDTAIHLIFQTTNHEDSNECKLSPIRFLALSGTRELLNVIDCGPWTEETGKIIEDSLLNAFAQRISKHIVQSTQNDWPSAALEQMKKVVVFDMYLKEGRFELALSHLEKDNDDLIPNTDDKFWLRDWCTPVYTHYGGVFALDRIFSFSNEYLKAEGKHTNMGQFIHLWSGAAKQNLKKLTHEVFGSPGNFEKQLKDAQAEWPKLKQECFDCDEPVDQGFLGTPEGLTLVIIIGVVSIVAITTISVIFGIKFFIYRRRIVKLKEQIRELTAEEVEEFVKGNSNYSGPGEANAPIYLLPFNNDFEIPLEQLNIEQAKILGSGEFGQVFLGTIKGRSTGNKLVAVKTVKPNVGVDYFKAMLTEIKIMAFLGQQENIASLVATVTTNIKNREVFAALEFCAKGDLLKYLQKNRGNFKNLWNHSSTTQAEFSCSVQNDEVPSTSTSNYTVVIGMDGSSNLEVITTVNLLDWGSQVANGMAYLSSKNVVHGDLAARNVLLTSDDRAKVSDFGLSRQLVNYTNYSKKSATPLPWRWMAIESLSEMIFSVNSDVWAFGVTLWEIFTLGKVPYPSQTWNHDFVDSLVAGDRLKQPEFANQEVYDLMTMHCWTLEPSERMPISQIRDQLESMKASLASCARLHGIDYYGANRQTTKV